MCSQYPKYQSVSIITISSGRELTVSPAPLRNFSAEKKTSKAFHHCSFYNSASFVSSQTKGAEKPNQGREYKSRPGGQTQSHGSNISSRSIMQPVIGLLMARRFPRGGLAETEEELFCGMSEMFFFPFLYNSGHYCRGAEAH